METSVDYPGLIWVKDPINLDGNLTGGPPRRRHHQECMHFYRAADGSLLGPPPYEATEEQMRTLPPCLTCAETNSAGAYDVTGTKAHLRGEVCQTCFIEQPLVGPCPNCGDE